MSRFEKLPENWGQARPIVQKISDELTAQSITLAGTRRRPEPPTNLQAQGGSLEILLTWNAASLSKGIVGWKVFKDNENNLVATIKDFNTRQYKHKMPADTTAAFYVCSINSLDRESIKVQVIGKSNTDKLVTTGTAGATSGTPAEPPPEWPDEPFGGGNVPIPL